MKFRITPFTIIWVIALGFAGYYWFALHMPFYPDARTNNNYAGAIVYLFGCLFLITLVLDLIFRFAIKNLKTIWIVETVLAVLAFAIIYFGGIVI